MLTINQVALIRKADRLGVILDPFPGFNLDRDILAAASPQKTVAVIILSKYLFRVRWGDFYNEVTRGFPVNFEYAAFISDCGAHSFLLFLVYAFVEIFVFSAHAMNSSRMDVGAAAQADFRLPRIL